MFSHSDLRPNLIIHHQHLSHILVLIFLGICLNGSSQVNVTVNVMPPYSTKLSDYSTNPNKVLATLQNVTPDGQTLNVYLGGTISSDGGIRVYTKPGFKPSNPITLLPGSVYIVNQLNLSSIFNAEQLVFEGITQNDIIYGNGLPEDIYTLCIRVYDYVTGQPLSAEAPSGCSAPFTVADLEPPVILQPACHDTITPMTPQSVLISWTRPAGAPQSTQYRFRMIEVIPPNHNPYDAMMAAAYPYFYESVITGNALIFGPAHPTLVIGKTYAFTVSAFDPVNQVRFRNEGMSEVCSFIYGEENVPKTPAFGQTPGEIIKDLDLVPQTTINGKLYCKYPTNPHDPIDPDALLEHFQKKSSITIPSSLHQVEKTGAATHTAQPYSGLNYNMISSTTKFVTGSANYNNLGSLYIPPTGYDNGAPQQLNDYGIPLLTPMNTKKYIFPDTESMENTKPLANTRVKLVARVAFMTVPGSFGIVHPRYGETSPIMMGLDLDGAFCGEVMKVINVVLDVTETDAQGNYSFSFRAPFFTGPVIGTDIQQTPIYDNQIDIMGDMLGGIMQEVVFPGVDILNNFGAMQNFGGQAAGAGGQQKVMMGGIETTDNFGYVCLKIEVENQKFCSPDIDIFAMPGDEMQLPAQVAKLKTYNLTVNVKSDDTPNQLNTPDAPLAGVKVSILRSDKKVSAEHPMIIDYEGQRLDKKTTGTNGTFKIVSTAQTNDSGKVYLPNLVPHAYISPQYLIELSTRDFDQASTDYDYTVFNYLDIFRGLETVEGNNAITTWQGRTVYNHEYPNPQEVNLLYIMKPLPPEIKGRVMAKSNIENIGLEGVNTNLLNQAKSNKYSDYASFVNGCYANKERYQSTNGSGFFRYENLPLKVNTGNGQLEGPYRRVYIKQSGYKSVVVPPISELPYKLLNGQLKDIKDINLEPINMFKGYIEDEDGKPVVCYVKSSGSPYYKTEKNILYLNFQNPSQSIYQETFQVPAAEGGNKTLLTITPLSSQYFERDTSALYSSNPIKVVVYKRLHRPSIKIKNSSGSPLAGVTVEVGGEKGTTDQQGIVRFRFAAASNQFIIRIIPGTGYAPLQQPVNIPVTSTWVNFEYALQAAKSIKGYIREKQSQQPVGNAVVFAELVVTGGSTLYLEAKSNATGFYQLQGIPKSLTQLTVHVIKEGASPSWAGTVQTISLPATAGMIMQNYNFEITKIEGWDLSTLWDFPVVIESFQPLKELQGKPARASVSGFFISPPAIVGYSLQQQGLRIPFNKITVTRSSGNKPVPESDHITLEMLEIPIDVGGTYYGKLINRTSTSTQGSSQSWGFVNMPPAKARLKMTKTSGSSDKAFIAGHVILDLASFKTAHDFSGTLYVSDNLTNGTTTVFSSAVSTYSLNRRFITSLDNQLNPVPVKNYRVFGFGASAIPDSSTISGSTIRMNTILHTAIPGCITCDNLDLKIRAGELVINGTEMHFQHSPGNRLSFELENWKVYSEKPWHFDINEEAIVLPEVLIVTGQGVDARVLNMKVRPKTLSEGTIDMNGGGLTLGGVATVKLSGTLKPLFNYDQGTGHYRISLVGETNKPAGWVENLPNTSPDKLEFASIGLLSNSNAALAISQNFRFYDIIDMYVDQVMTGPGFFKLNGQPETEIPGYYPPSSLVTYKPGANNKLVCEVEPLQGYVTCHGNVEFILDLNKQQTTKGRFTSYGDVKIKPSTGESGSPVFLRGLLTKTKTGCEISIITVDALTKKYSGPEMQTMMCGNNIIMVQDGEAKVTGGKWGALEYTGITSQIAGLTDNNGNPNTLKFKVLGGIDVSADDISVTNISTPLGGMNLVYNFSDGSMVGTLTMKDIPLGYAYLKQGLATVRFDQKGYYIVINLQDFAVGPHPGMPGFRGGFIAGATNGVAQSDIATLQQSFRKNLPDFTTTGLTGFYVLGEKVLFNTDIPLIFTDVGARAGLGLYVNTNFVQDPEFIVGGYGYCELDGSASWEIPKVGPSCGAGINTQVNFDVNGGYKNGTFQMNNCGAIKVKPYVTGSCKTVLDHLGFDEILKTITDHISIKAEFGLQGSDFYMNLKPFETCL